MRFWSRRRALADLDQDIRDHIEIEVQENIERGMTPAEARRTARRRFGNVTLVQEDTRAVWHAIWLDQLLQDARYALRSLRRQPGFTAVVVTTLALGIGMNTAVFSVLNSVLLRKLPYPDSERLMWLANYHQGSKHDNWVARADYVTWKEQARSFEKMTAYGTQDLAVVVRDAASQERIASVSGDFWSITGAQPVHGRLFQSRDVNAIVLSSAFFERRFGGDVRAIGTTVTVNGWPFTVTGVLPRNYRFLFPQQVAAGDELRDVDAYIPIPGPILPMPPAGLQHWETVTRQYGPAPFWICVVGKLKADALPEAARTEMQTIYARIAQQDPGPLRTSRVLRITTLQDKLVGDVRRPLLVLLVAVAFVLMIACANVTNLLLARASVRQREIAVRTAVGAGRARVIRQLLTESVMLALVGCGAGLLLGYGAVRIMLRLAPHAVPRLSETAIDARVLGFTVAISVVAGLLFGLAPAMLAWRREVSESLRTDAGTSSSGIGRTRLRSALAAAELALAIVLLTGAGLMLRSFWRMNEKPAGFRPENILVMRVTLSGPQYSSWRPKQAYTEELLRAVQDLPGIEAAGVDTGSLNATVQLDRATTGDGVFASIRGVSSGYLQAMGLPLVEGSWPARGSLFGVVVNEAFARHIGAEAIGRHVGGSILNDTITGIVADVKSWKLDAEPLPEIYMPYERLPVNRSMRVVVRTAGGVAALAPEVRKLISAIDRTQPVYEFQTLEEALSASIAPRRFNLFLLGVFATTALLLALIGIYGVIAYSVSLRTREIGIRLALGAHRGEVLAMVIRQAMVLALAGVAIGLAAALGLTRLMASLLYGVKPDDPWTFGAVGIALTTTALLAAAGPAVRAARVDPVVALRYE